MDEATQTKLISDVAYIRGKVAHLPEIRKQVSKNSQAISRIRGIMAILGAICVIAAPIAVKFLCGR